MLRDPLAPHDVFYLQGFMNDRATAAQDDERMDRLLETLLLTFWLKNLVFKILA